MAVKSKSGASISKNEPKGRSMHPLLWLVLILILLAGLFCWSWKHMAVAACKTENLTLTAGQQSGAAGTIYQHMVITNTGKKKCTMAGYPTAFLYGPTYALGSGAAARPQPAPVTVTLAHNQTANTILGYPQAGNFDPGVCSSTKSVSLWLYPPSATTPLTVPLEVAWCPGFSESSIQAGS